MEVPGVRIQPISKDRERLKTAMGMKYSKA